MDNRNAKQVRVVSLRLRTLVLLASVLITSLSTCFWIYHKETLNQHLLAKNSEEKLLALTSEEKPKIIKKIAKQKEPSPETLSLFLSELTRLRSYEKTIKERFEAIRSVVKSVVGADFSDDVSRKKGASSSLEKGVGGREFDADLISSIDFGIDFLNAAPIGIPLEGSVTSGYGYRISPFSHTKRFHRGIDIAISKHSHVISTADGIVTYAGYRRGYGTTVEISHKLGYKTLFAHLSATLVQPGQKVCREQIIGLVGMTGRTTGPHLHYEIKRHGIHKNPKPYLAMTKLLSVAVD